MLSFFANFKPALVINPNKINKLENHLKFMNLSIGGCNNIQGNKKKKKKKHSGNHIHKPLRLFEISGFGFDVTFYFVVWAW